VFWSPSGHGTKKWGAGKSNEHEKRHSNVCGQKNHRPTLVPTYKTSQKGGGRSGGDEKGHKYGKELYIGTPNERGHFNSNSNI